MATERRPGRLHSPFHSGTIETIRRYHVHLTNIPPSGEVWTTAQLRKSDEYEPLPNQLTISFIKKGILERHPTTFCHEDQSTQRQYELVEEAQEIAEMYRDEIDKLPCCGRGTGFENLGSDGDEPPYACTECGERHPRHVIEEVLF